MAALPTNGSVVQAPRSVHVGLDIGTYASGFAFSERAAPVRCHESWPDQTKPYPKTRSIILYKARHVLLCCKTPVAFGWSALKELAKVPQQEQKSYSLIDASVFKLGLHDPSRAAKLPPGLTAVQRASGHHPMVRVFLEYPQIPWRKPKHSHPTWILPSMAKWIPLPWILCRCMTVPAMWGDASKHAMREAALRAGFIHKLDSDALSIILEPEAAAIYALDKKAPPLLSEFLVAFPMGLLSRGLQICLTGESVMVIDAGGGTVDTTIHVCQSKGGHVVLAEAVHAAGALSGSVMVDEEFKIVVSGSFANNLFTRAEQPDLMAEGYIPHSDHTAGPAAAWEAGLGGQGEGYAYIGLHGTHSMMIILVLLVGGFASSPYLQLCWTLGRQASLWCPPALTPLSFQVLLAGIHPEFIHARRSKLSYGVKLCIPYQPGYPGMFTHRETGELMTDKGFKLFVSKDEMVELDSTTQHTVSPLYSNQSAVSIPVYASDRCGSSINFSCTAHPRYVDDAEPDTRKTSAVVQVQIPPSYIDARDASIRVQMLFGRTELVLKAWEAKSGLPVQTSIKFAHAL
ncbi:hypothetical protein DUNSADRAFT_10930 [Dunaliella salina]|uniref:Uncharacterized protein n=1 Tax=Dunaliella salina TaxID=3046 RepID=A0ABQ7GEH7_DUNSA|nr:hypothetical protein DUNSADRAFT_10930 [Dunaliella salina]|eukprot:KAF5833009.1 hypothetical protein DUNSADRAFT_10930 [Dunaliella salina]